MRSEHNGGASLAAFLLAVSTMTLLFVSPVEGQVGDACVVTAFPGEPESCPVTDGQGKPLFCLSGQCQLCESVFNQSDCETAFAGNADQIANCFRDCGGVYLCTSGADCPAHRPTCDISSGATEGDCVLECEVNALPGAAGSCPDIVGEFYAGPQFCVSLFTDVSVCEECARYEEDFTITTAAECELLLLLGETEDVVANCQRGCFGFYACGTNADCPDSLPFCTNGQCEACLVTAFPGETGSCPPLDDQGNPLLCSSGQCQTCESAGITSTSFINICRSVFADEDQQENCLRDCFSDYDCTSDADCPADRPTCFDGGPCRLECEVSALPDASGSCPDQVGSYNAGPQFCFIEDGTGICAYCTPFEQTLGITTAADCEKLTNINQNADVVANCQRGCFGFFACATSADCPADRPLCESGQCLAECGTNAECPADRPLCDAGQCLAECATNAECPADRPLCESGQCFAECATNADCPADRPICNAGQCEISVFSPLDGMGGGSSA